MKIIRTAANTTPTTDTSGWSLDQFKAYFAENSQRLLADPAMAKQLAETGRADPADVGRLVGGDEKLVKMVGLMLGNTPEAQVGVRARFARDWAALDAEDKDGYLYHVTPKANLRTIKTRGLLPNGARANFGGFYQGYSAGKLFLCDKGGVEYWKDRILTNREHATGGTIKLAVVRVRRDAVPGLQTDKPGTDDSRHGAYFTTQSIPASAIEIVSA